MIERRQYSRKRAKASIYLYCPGQRFKRCKISNLSASGMFIESSPLNVGKGRTVEVVFTTSTDSVIRIHRRHASIAHISDEGVGMMLTNFAS